MRASGSGSAYSSPPGSLRSGKAGGSLTGRCVSGPALGAFPAERSEPPEPALASFPVRLCAESGGGAPVSQSLLVCEVASYFHCAGKS